MDRKNVFEKLIGFPKLEKWQYKEAILRILPNFIFKEENEILHPFSKFITINLLCNYLL